MAPESWTILLGIWHNNEFIGCQDVEAKNFASLKTVSTGSWLKKSAQGQGLGKEMRAAALSYAFDFLKTEEATSEAAAWNKQSLGVSASLGYGFNGSYRDQWGADVVEVQRVRLAPEAFIRPDWKLKVDGHEAAAKFLGL
ncbi:GNAT family N-acetyltransferase [Arthrobacter sp. KN11-1C]|uniref:GNAT family N-acetyltransferase n=1 Tax=Arthrobacter sp. KN11-1C TaxID=3445774 RepID=UPI003FA0B405